MRLILILISIIGLSVHGFSFSSNGDRSDIPVYMNVMKVVDGDTFWAYDGNHNPIKIRLIGVDAPESRNSGQKKTAYYGQQSKAYLTKLIANKKVRLEYDIGRKDQYSRILAYVYLTDGTFVNAELIKKGYAMVMTVPPNVRYAKIFLNLERKARKKNKGLWNEKQSDNLTY
jgi:micrococcal nuclease